MQHPPPDGWSEIGILIGNRLLFIRGRYACLYSTCSVYEFSGGVMRDKDFNTINITGQERDEYNTILNQKYDWDEQIYVFSSKRHSDYWKFMEEI